MTIRYRAARIGIKARSVAFLTAGCASTSDRPQSRSCGFGRQHDHTPVGTPKRDSDSAMQETPYSPDARLPRLLARAPPSASTGQSTGAALLKGTAGRAELTVNRP